MLKKESFSAILFSLYSVAELIRINYAPYWASFPLLFLGSFIFVMALNLRRKMQNHIFISLTAWSKLAVFWYLANLYTASFVTLSYDYLISIFLWSQILILGILLHDFDSSFNLYAFELAAMITVIYIMFVAIVSLNVNLVIIVPSFFASWLFLMILMDKHFLNANVNKGNSKNE